MPSGGGQGALIASIAGVVVLVLVTAAAMWFGLRHPEWGLPGAAPEATPDASSGSPTLDRLREQGYVTLGIVEGPPSSFVDDSGEPSGQSPEVARAVFAELGVPEVRSTTLEWEMLVPALLSGEVDAVAAAMTLTPEWCSQVAFADPDLRHPTTFLVEEGNPEGVADFTDFTDSELVLGVLEWSPEYEYAQAAGVPQDRMVVSPDLFGTLAMLENGEVDALVGSSMWLRHMVEEEGDLLGEGGPYEVTDPFVSEVDGREQVSYSGLAFSQQDSDILDSVNPVLADLLAEGRLLEIGEPFGVTEEELPPPGTTAEDACAG